MLAEYGWHGGGTFPIGTKQSKPGTEEDQARWCTRLIETTAPLAAGWLNWGFYDHPGANDVSARTGLLTADGQEKVWGRRFQELAARLTRQAPLNAGMSNRPDFPWEKCIVDPKAADEFRAEYYKVFLSARGGGN